MSLKPKITLTEELNTQTLALKVRKDELTLTRDEVLARLNSIEQVLKENEILVAKTHEQVTESVNMYLEEWIKMREYYPEVRLGILQKTLEFVMPPDQKKKL
jgi:hypothetical protein